MTNCRAPLRGARFRGSVTVNIQHIVLRQYVAPPSGVLYLVLLEMGFYTISSVNVPYRRAPLRGAMGSSAWFVDLLHLVPAAKCRAPLRGVLGLVCVDLEQILHIVCQSVAPPAGAP